ncbi:hypothetical protein CK203_055302 [Vitis vinifera]|uniref:UBA domain-containing protein n=1 Tax=Vitis vinifera TaxID=29760 RepID=A0A438GV13_VITVI|nr:hypothetical protein CK203_055302 [Vitis vinifera]
MKLMTIVGAHLEREVNMMLLPIMVAGLVSLKIIKKKHLIHLSDRRQYQELTMIKEKKIRQKNERKHQRQKERRAQELHERCSGYLMSRKLEALAQQLVAMGFTSERATMALILNEGRVEESVSWLFEGGEEADKHKSENLDGGNNLKIDIAEELAQITGLEMRRNLKSTEARPPSTPPNSEETDDPLTITNGKLPVAVSQNPLRQSTKSNSSSTIQQRRDEKDFNYTKSPATIGTSSEPGSKNVQPLKGTQPKLEWARQQQIVSQSPAKTETRFAAVGNEFKNLQPGPVREPVIVMQRPQSINLKHVSSTSMNSSPPGTAAGWYHSNFEIAKSNGLSPNIPSTRNLNLNDLSANQLYHQHHYQTHQQLMSGSSPAESPGTHRGNGSRSRMSTSPSLAAASSLGLFSGLGSTVSSGSSSPVDWSTGGQMQLLDYTSIDWTLDRNLSNGRPSGGLWQGMASLVNNNAYMHDSNASVVVGNPTMRIIPPNGNGIPIPGLQGGGSANAEASAGSSREWTSPFEERDLFSLPEGLFFRLLCREDEWEGGSCRVLVDNLLNGKKASKSPLVDSSLSLLDAFIWCGGMWWRMPSSVATPTDERLGGPHLSIKFATESPSQLTTPTSALYTGHNRTERQKQHRGDEEWAHILTYVFMALSTPPILITPRSHHPFSFPTAHHPSKQAPFSSSSSSISRPLQPLRLLSPPTTTFHFKCFSKAQRQSDDQVEFERLFSNLNQATLKREPGSLSSAIFLVAGTTVGAGILAIPAVTQESGFLASAVTCFLCWVVTGLLIAEVNVNTMCELGSGGVSLVSMAMRTLGPVGVQIACGSLLHCLYSSLWSWFLHEFGSRCDAPRYGPVAPKQCPVFGWVKFNLDDGYMENPGQIEQPISSCCSWSYLFIHYALLVAYVARSSDILTNFLGIPMYVS